MRAPRAALVTDVTPEGGFRARDHLTDEEDETMPAKFRGRSRVYPEINVLNAAKSWHRIQLALSKARGYLDPMAYAKSQLTPEERVLFTAVTAMKKWEKG
jgi:hypothetical protein